MPQAPECVWCFSAVSLPHIIRFVFVHSGYSVANLTAVWILVRHYTLCNEASFNSFLWSWKNLAPKSFTPPSIPLVVCIYVFLTLT
jgi:hypothetical protein